MTPGMRVVAASAAEVPEPDDSANTMYSPDGRFVCERHRRVPGDLAAALPAGQVAYATVTISTSDGEVLLTLLEVLHRGCLRAWRFVEDDILLVTETMPQAEPSSPREVSWRLDLTRRTFTSSQDPAARPLRHLSAAMNLAREGVCGRDLQDARARRTVGILAVVVFGLSLLILPFFPVSIGDRICAMACTGAAFGLCLKFLHSAQREVLSLELVRRAEVRAA